MNTRAKNYCSILAAIGFLLIAAASSHVNKLHCGAFNTFPSGEEPGDGRSYVLMNDGHKVYGDKISWKTGLLVKDQIKVDGEKYMIKETRGYFSNGIYYGRLGGSYAQRIVHGKINVYYTEDMVTSTSTSASGAIRTTTRPVCLHYSQVGENGPLEPIANQGDIKKLVADCPLALEMIDKKDKEIRRSIRKNNMYLNNIFITYNNGCR